MNRLRRKILLLCLFLPASASAETYSLTEKRVIDLALERNVNVATAEIDREVAQTYVQGAKSVFDTSVKAQVNHLVDKSDQAIPIFGTDNRTTNFNVGVSRAFPTGTRAGVDWTNQRNSTNSPFAVVNPYYDSRLDFSLRQPLLRNAFGAIDRGNVTAAWKHLDRVTYASRRRSAEAVYGVLYDYWKWIADRANVELTRRSLDEARTFESLSEKKKIFGIYETTDILSARANRSLRESDLVEAVRLRDDDLGRLKRQLDFGEDDRVESSQSLAKVSFSGSRETVLRQAFQRRSDYRAAKSLVEARDVEASIAKNKKWPVLDAVGSVGVNGIDGAYGSSLDEIRATDHPRYFVGGELQWTVENRFARAESKRAEQEKKRALRELKDVEKRIAQEVDANWREVQASRKELSLLSESEKALREKWREEGRKYETGRSSSDFVSRFQEDYLAAQRQTLAAWFRYRMAVVGLKLAQETLLPEEGENHR